MGKKRDGRKDDKLPRMDFYPADFLSDPNVMAMSSAAVGVYIKILCHLWQSGPLTSDLGRLSRIVGGGETEKTLRKLWPEIEPCLREGPTSGTIIQGRVERERERALHAKGQAAEDGRRSRSSMTPEQRSASAKQAALARWEREQRGEREAPSHGDARDPRISMPGYANPSPSPSPSTHTPPYPPEGGASCVRGSAIADPNKGPAIDAGVASPPRPEPEPVPPDDDLDAHIQAAWNRLGREIRHRPHESLSGKHREAWGSLLEACESDLAECEETLREYFLCEEPKLKDAGWTINLFPFRAGGIIARIRAKKAKRLKPLPATPAESEPPVDPEAAKAARERIRAMLKAPAEATTP